MAERNLGSPESLLTHGPATGHQGVRHHERPVTVRFLKGRHLPGSKQADAPLLVGRSAFRKVLSLGFRITARNNAGGKGTA
jgi:hypothetical protein